MKQFSTSLLLLILITGLSNAQNVEIPDTAFLHEIIEKGVDTNGDSVISFIEAEAITYLDISGDGIFCPIPFAPCWNEGEIRSLTGIEAFINLDSLDCKFNRIDSIVLPSTISLKYLDYSYNNRKIYVNIFNKSDLTHLNCDHTNNYDTLDMSNYPALTNLSCERNYIYELDVSGILI